jgi:radical SAM protein with 4Fe4S-binding SPASM domain
MKPEFSYAKTLTPGEYTSKTPLLSRLDLELTERCNNNCIHCYIRRPEKDLEAQEKEMTAGKIKDILLEAASLGCIPLRLTGGEPLLRPDFPEIYSFARRQGLQVTLYTNATQIDHTAARLFKRIPPLKPVEVTVYGMSKKSYEHVSRTPGSFDAAMQGIRLLAEYGVPFHIKGVLIPPDEAEMKKMEAWASALPGDIPSPNFAVHFDLRARRDSSSRNAAIRTLRLSPEKALAVQSRDKDNWLRDRREFCRRFLNPAGDTLFDCGAGKGYLAIDPYGIVQPCLLLRHPDFQFNLGSGTLKQALKEFRQTLQSFKSNNPDFKDRCARCFISSLCEQCPAKAWMEHGTLDTPVEYYCRTAHLEAEKLGLLEPGEKAWDISDWRDRVMRLTGKNKQGANNAEKTGS